MKISVYGELANWAIGDYLNGKNGTPLRGAFAGGADSLEKFQGQYSARIDGLWRTPELSGFYGFVSLPENPRGTYWIKFDSNQPYLVSGLYTSNSLSETGQAGYRKPQHELVKYGFTGNCWGMAQICRDCMLTV